MAIICRVLDSGIFRQDVAFVVMVGLFMIVIMVTTIAILLTMLIETIRIRAICGMGGGIVTVNVPSDRL